LLPHRMPLKTFRAFDAVARHGSFRAAADELFVSQSAISQQIQSLEKALGVPLFRRMTRRTELTDAGRTLAAATRNALENLNRAVQQIQQRPEHEDFAIGALTSFSSRWLTRRISRFCAALPQLDVSIYPVFDPKDMDQHRVDIAILYGDGSWKGHVSEEVFREYIFPVCHPALLRGQRLEKIQDLLSLPLLRDADPLHDYWASWLAAAGCNATRPSGGPKFDNLSDMITAAIDGHGVALVRSALVTDEIQEGRLIRLFDLNFRAQYAYYLVWPKHPGRSEITAIFRRWLLEEFESTPGVVPVAAAHSAST
jgi:LysR family transcriptional regulator, glycine cleavage system transcriptional activator